MVFIRIFKILFVTAVNPMKGFDMYLSDPREKLTRRLAYWLLFVGTMTMLYFMVFSMPNEFRDPPFLAWMTILFLKFFGIFMFFFFYAIAGVIAGIKDVQFNPIQFTTAIYTFTLVPELIFLVSVYFFPEFYQEIRLTTHIWRVVLMSLGTYVMVDLPMKKSILVGALGSLPLFFFNYNYFAAMETGY